MASQFPKQTLSESALVELLNWELAAYDECAGCHFTAVTAVKAVEADEDCNWAGARIVADHRLGLAEEAITHLIVAQTQRAYNLRR